MRDVISAASSHIGYGRPNEDSPSGSQSSKWLSVEQDVLNGGVGDYLHLYDRFEG